MAEKNAPDKETIENKWENTKCSLIKYPKSCTFQIIPWLLKSFDWSGDTKACWKVEFEYNSRLWRTVRIGYGYDKCGASKIHKQLPKCPAVCCYGNGGVCEHTHAQK